MESIIKDRVLSFLNANNLLSANQHGIKPNKFTFTQLVECILGWTAALETRSLVLVIYIDFKISFYSAIQHYDISLIV